MTEIHCSIMGHELVLFWCNQVCATTSVTRDRFLVTHCSLTERSPGPMLFGLRHVLPCVAVSKTNVYVQMLVNHLILHMYVLDGLLQLHSWCPAHN